MWTWVEDGADGPRGQSRRAVLRSAVGAALGVTAVVSAGGCGLFGDDPSPPPSDPLDPLLVGALALAGQYDTAMIGHPDLTDRLTPLRDAHRAHAAALARLLGRPTDAPTAAASSGAAPPDAASTLAQLRAAERTGQAEATSACLAAPAARTALLGSIAAARATHQEMLS